MSNDAADEAQDDQQGEKQEEKQEGQLGSSDPSKRFREMEVSEEEQEEIAREREERLKPENRPENAEVDNTQRKFDGEKFVD